MSKVKPEAMLSNISGINGDTITKTVQATTYAFDLLNESESNAGEATEHIGDVLTNVSKNMRYDFKAGIVGLNDAIKTSGSVARESGMSLEQYSSYMGALIERTGKTGSELGTFWKMLTARVQQIKAVGDEVGISREDMGNAEKALTNIGVSVRGENNSLRDMDSVLKDVNAKWSSLSEQEKSQVAEGVAGNRHRATFLSLMRSMTTEQKLYGEAVNSTGALEQANEVKAESLEGKLNTLKDTVQVFFDTIISGNALKGGVDMFSNIVGGITNVTRVLGTLPTVITTVVGALTIFNAKFRESMATYQPTFLTNWTNGLTGLKTKLTESIGVQKQNIISLRAYIAEQQSAGNSTMGLQGKLALMQAGLVATTAKEIACTVATVALQTAFTMGLSLVITGVVSGLMSLANSSDSAKQKMDELSSSIKQNSDSVAQSQELLNKKIDLESQISKTNEGTKENTELKKQLLDVERQISDALPSSTSGFDAEGKAISSNTDIIKAQIQAKKDKIAVDAQELLNNAKDINKTIKEAELMQKQIESVKLAQKQGNPVAKIPVSLDTDETMEIRYTDDYVSRVEKRLTGLKSTISDTRLAILQLKQAGKSNEEIKIMYPEIDPSEIDRFSEAIEKSTNKTKADANTKEDNANKTKVLAEANKELQSSNGNLSADTIKKITEEYPEVANNADKAREKVDGFNKSLKDAHTKEIQDATDSYEKSAESIAKATGFLDKLNKAGEVTPAIASSVLKVYPELATQLGSVSSLQDGLTQKIKEQQEAQSEAYLTMMQDDEVFYKNKVANNDEFKSAYNNFLKAFVSDGQEADDVDFNNFKNLNELKQGTQHQLGQVIETWLTQFVGDSATGYADDFDNFKTIAQQKASVLAKLNEEIKKINQNLAGAEFMVKTIGGWTEDQEGYSDKFDTHMTEKLTNDIDTYKSKIGELNGAVKEVDTNFDGFGASMKGFSGGDIGGQTDLSGTGGSGGSGGSDKSAKEAEKWADKINDLNSTIETDRYYDANNAIKQLDSTMSALKVNEEGLTGAELTKVKNQENEVINKQIEAYKNLQKVQESERDEIKDKLAQYGILTDSTGQLINAQQKLADEQARVNALSGNTEEEYNAKKTAIEQVKELSENIKKFGDITNSTIPDTIDKWNELANSMKKAKMEQIESMKDELVKGLQKKYEDEKETKMDSVEDWYKKKKEAMQSEFESDKKNLQDEMQDEVDHYQGLIDDLQKRLDELNDTSADKNAKLAKMKAELALWQKDTSVFSKSKQESLTNSISELQKEIEKDNIQKEIDDLKKKQDAEKTYKDDKLTALEDSNKKEEQELEDSYNKQKDEAEDMYKKLLDEHSLYSEADKLILSNQMEAMTTLLESTSEDFKTAGS